MSSIRFLSLAAAVCASFLTAQAPAPSAPPGAAPAPVESQPLPPPQTTQPASPAQPSSPPQTAQPAPAAPPSPPAPAQPPAAAPPTMGQPAPAVPANPAPTTAPPQQAAPSTPSAPAQPQPAPSQQATPAPTQPPALDALATLAPGTTDPSGADEVMLTAKPTASLRGQAAWEGGFIKIQAALMLIRSELKKAGIKEAGRPLTIFLTSDDEKFTFEAMVPIDPAANMQTALGNEVKLSQTPAGKAIRFGHKGPYDNIDETYEVLTAYLDAKGIEARDAFIEEYLSENLAPSDENFELQIYVQPK